MKTEKTKQIVLFYCIVLIFSYFAWFATVIMGISSKSLPGVVLVALGGIGPTLGALVMLKFFSQKEEVKRYIGALNPKIITPKWYAIILLLPLLFVGTSLLLAIALGEDYSSGMFDPKYISSPISLIPFAIFTLFFGPLPEELGWRGYALDRLVQKIGPIGGGLINGLLWATWHIPLFFIIDYPLKEMNLSGLALGRYFFEMIPKSILYVWIYYRTGKSTVSAILFHFSSNYFGMIFQAGYIAEYIHTAMIFLSAISVCAFDRKIFWKWKNEA